MPSSFRLDARTETALTSCSVVALTFLPSRACRRQTTSGSEDLSERSVLVNELDFDCTTARSASFDAQSGDAIDAQGSAQAESSVGCCYPLYEPLLEHALQLAKTGFAMSYPRDRWFVRAGIWFENAMRRCRGNSFRAFVHPPSEMMRIVERARFEPEPTTHACAVIRCFCEILVRVRDEPRSRVSGSSSSYRRLCFGGQKGSHPMQASTRSQRSQPFR